MITNSRWAKSILLVALGAAAPAGAAPISAVPGVMTHEIIVGTHMDLSGPLALWGTATRNGLALAIDEANAGGGVRGRKITLIAKDDKYDEKEAKSAVRELVTQDHVFAVLSPVGTPTVLASMRVALDHGVPHLFPIVADAQSYLPLQPLKFATTPSYANEIEAGLNALLARVHARKVAVLYQDNAFGVDVRDGVEIALMKRGVKPAAMIGFAAGSTNLGSEIAKLKSAGADIVVLGSVVQDTLAALRAGAARGFHPVFLCSAACYAPETATLGGPLAEGLYAVTQVPIPYPDAADKALRAWVARYQKKFGSAPNVYALQAYLNARLFIDALALTGASPTQAAFAHTLETMGAWVDPQLGGLPVQFSASDHLGVHAGLLARVHNGRWVMEK